MGKAVVVTDENFEEEVLRCNLPVLVDFWATWCGPCKSIAPAIDELASEYGGKVKVAKADVQESQMAATKHRITSIPTILLFRNGKVVDEVIGAVPVSELRKRVEEGLLA
jgi:thioredoxin 1